MSGYNFSIVIQVMKYLVGIIFQGFIVYIVVYEFDFEFVINDIKWIVD